MRSVFNCDCMGFLYGCVMDVCVWMYWFGHCRINWNVLPPEPEHTGHYIQHLCWWVICLNGAYFACVRMNSHIRLACMRSGVQIQIHMYRGTDKSRSVEIQKDNKCGWSVRIWSNMEYVSRISVRDWCSTGLSFWECINWVYVELNDGTSIEREYVSKIHSLLLNSLLMELMHSPNIPRGIERFCMAMEHATIECLFCCCRCVLLRPYIIRLYIVWWFLCPQFARRKTRINIHFDSAPLEIRTLSMCIQHGHITDVFILYIDWV